MAAQSEVLAELETLRSEALEWKTRKPELERLKREVSTLRLEASDWRSEKATLEQSMGEATSWLGRHERLSTEHEAVLRQRDDLHTKLAQASVRAEEAEKLAARVEKQLEKLKKKKGSGKREAAKQWNSERRELQQAKDEESAALSEMQIRLEMTETRLEVAELARAKLQARVEASVAADASRQDLAEAHTATVEQNRKLVADLATVQAAEAELKSCRSELANTRASLKKESAKSAALEDQVSQLEPTLWP